LGTSLLLQSGRWDTGHRVLLNNEDWDAAQLALAALPWERHPWFYSARVFLVLSRFPGHRLKINSTSGRWVPLAVRLSGAVEHQIVLASGSTVNSDVMQLSHSLNRIAVAAVLSLVTVVSFSCHKSESRPIRVSLCELYRNPATYDGKRVTVTATITQLPNGKYLYPGPSRDCSYSFIKVDANLTQYDSLTQLEPSTASSEREEGIRCRGDG
jgi:hypothetical protein